jgi:hypothetical protein
MRAGYMYYSILTLGSTFFNQVQEGLFEEGELDRIFFRGGIMEAPYLKSVWPVIRENFNEDYAAFVERRFRLAPPHPEGAA